MITIIKGAGVYAPEYMGIKDVLLVGDKIGNVEDGILLEGKGIGDVTIIDGRNKILTPGFVDSHVHILGGGGEGGYRTRTPEINLTDITTGGVTTVVGCLGTDGIGRDMISLLAKARALEEEGITTFIYSGSYRVPITTITGDVMKDLMAIDKVIGVGEIAISDHRSSQSPAAEVKKLVADVRVGGMLSGKAGIVNFHVGDARQMLDILYEIAESTDIPLTQFLPTHLNRNRRLFEESMRYARAGGYVDFTTSSDPLFWEQGEVKASEALRRCLEEGVPDYRITFSSDGQGSLPIFDEKREFAGLRVATVKSLLDEVRDAVVQGGVPLEKAIKVITANPASILKLKGKGRIARSFDADLVLLDEDGLGVDTVIARGRIMVQNKEVRVFGTFENRSR